MLSSTQSLARSDKLSVREHFVSGVSLGPRTKWPADGPPSSAVEIMEGRSSSRARTLTRRKSPDHFDLEMSNFGEARFIKSAARLLLLVVLTAAASRLASAQNYAVDRFVIGGGGGTSTNAQFSVSGTIGQPEAGTSLVGGRFAVEGGFWSEAIVVSNAGAPTPTLVLLKASGTLFFSWPLSAVGFVLESSPILGPSAAWSSVNAPVQTGAQYRYVLLRPQPGIQFYRLRKVTVAQ